MSDVFVCDVVCLIHPLSFEDSGPLAKAIEQKGARLDVAAPYYTADGKLGTALIGIAVHYSPDDLCKVLTKALEDIAEGHHRVGKPATIVVSANPRTFTSSEYAIVLGQAESPKIEDVEEDDDGFLEEEEEDYEED